MDTTLLKPVHSITGQKGRLYYYKGNFFHPLNLHGKDVGRVKRAILQFIKENADLIAKDQASADYKTLNELAFPA